MQLCVDLEDKQSANKPEIVVQVSNSDVCVCG